nr:uncharacterized protein LOC123759406 [Procambarus clarkii]
MEEQDGLPEVYFSPSCHAKCGRGGTHTSSDTDHNVWEDDIDNETWVALVPEMTATEHFQLSQEVSMVQQQDSSSLGVREEIEGVSSLDSSAVGNNFLLNRNPSLNRDSLNINQTERSGDISENIQSGESEGTRNDVEQCRGIRECSGQRGETPGSDCPPVAGVGMFSSASRQPPKLNTNFPVSPDNELIFLSGGDEGFMVPGGVHAYYGSDSDTEPLEWGAGGDNDNEALGPVRDAVEGADSGTPSLQASLGNVTPSGLEDMERNSPAGLSTPEADVDLAVATGNNLKNKNLKNSIRPPVVGQSDELLVQTSRKDLGSTDGEESEDESKKRLPLKSAKGTFSTPEAQPGSLGSQSENTDSVNTVLDMSRGEIQGCETDETLDTPLLSPSIISESSTSQSCPKPVFVVGGLISPRGKFRQFQNTVRDRMQDMKASLELQPGIDSQVHVNRDQFLSQPPLYPPIISVSEQEISLASMISVESTNHPDSSERVTSPSALSVSSAASSRKMEWDSGADVGYSGNAQEHLVTSLSTLERIAIGNYASVLRTEPEGTTQVKEKQKISKKCAKSTSTKAGNNISINRQTIMEGVVSSPFRSLRVHKARDKVNLSSSDEDMSSKLSSPSQSPRRRLRRRSFLTKDVDLSSRKMHKDHILNKRFGKVSQERHSEGKSSSLVELASTCVKVSQYQRSSSQQSLSLPHNTSESNVNVEGSVSVAEESASSVTTAVYQNKKLEIFLESSSIANISTSTSTLLHSASPIPLMEASASNSSTFGGEKSQQHARGKKNDLKSVSEETKNILQSSLQPFESQTNIHGRTWTSSGNDISSKSHDSSDMETPSDMKDTDVDSCTSHHYSDGEPVNLKARKNSENAKNHENIIKCSRSMIGSADQNNWNDNDSNSCSSSLQVGGQRASPQDSESVLESQVSLQSSNNSLQALSVKLKERIRVLLDNGSLKKVQDYNKLQDYIQFIGIPSTNEEECRLKQGVASVIVRMFGEIGLDDTDTSNTFNSETSEVLTTDSQTSDQRPQTMSEHTAYSPEDLDVPLSQGMMKAEDYHQCGTTVDDRRPVTRRQEHTLPGSTVTVVPYRPSSATRTYFMAVSHECDEGVVEGEHAPTPERGSPALLAPDSETEVSRGQAEGQLEDVNISLSSPAPSIHQLQDWKRENNLNSDRNSEDPQSPVEAIRPYRQTSATVKNMEGELESASVVATRPRDWDFGLGDGKNQETSSTVVTSDECSSHNDHRFTQDRQSNWHKEELGRGCKGSVNWLSSTTRSERLYKDKQGIFHVANQPPGYMDDHDSHPSESMSDHEDHNPKNNDTESQEETRRVPARLWTSSGSESAYETIRERHRHVDEALASSFEFYSTSPRDARLLGYISNDEGEDQGQEESQNQLVREESPKPPSPSSPPLSEEPVSNRAARPKRHASHWQQQHVADGPNSSPSSQTDGNDVSSQVSFIKLQKQRYVRKIQRHIHTLDKLERALLEQLGNSIGSESSFRCETEGRSHTQSNTNSNSRPLDILGQSEMATSSILSRDYGDKRAQRKSHQSHHMGRLSKNVMEIEPVGQESYLHSTERSESMKSATGQSTLGQSYASSPGLTLSRLSSDLSSSQASTMQQIEEEVRKLALTEERTREMMNARLRTQTPTRDDVHFQDVIKKMEREKPRGKDNPVWSHLASKRSTSDTTLNSNLYVKNKILQEFEALDSKLTTVNRNYNRQPTEACVISEEEFTDRAISDGQISRRGDGSEARDRNQVIKVTPMVYIGDDNRPSSLESSSARNANIQTKKRHSRNKQLRDFGQMFPSTENVLTRECDGSSNSDLSNHSVGIQTGESLLCLNESSRKSNVMSSFQPSSSTTCDPKYVRVGGAASRSMRTFSRSGLGRAKSTDVSKEKQVLEAVSGQTTDVTTNGKDKHKESRSGQRKGERSHSRNAKDMASYNYQLDRNTDESSKIDMESKGKLNAYDAEQGLVSKSRMEKNGKRQRTSHGIKSSSRSESDGSSSSRVYSVKDGSSSSRAGSAKDGSSSSRTGSVRDGSLSSRVDSMREKSLSSRAGPVRDESSSSRAVSVRDGSSSRAGSVRDGSSSRAGPVRDVSSSRAGPVRDVSSSRAGSVRDVSSSRAGSVRDGSASRVGSVKDGSSSSRTVPVRDGSSSSRAVPVRDGSSSSRAVPVRDGSSSSRAVLVKDGSSSSRAGLVKDETSTRAEPVREKSSSRVGFASDGIEHIKQYKSVKLSKPDAEGKYKHNEKHRAVPRLSRHGTEKIKTRHISKDRVAASLVSRSADRQDGHVENSKREASSRMGLGRQNKYSSNTGSEDGSRPVSARSEDGSRPASARSEDGSRPSSARSEDGSRPASARSEDSSRPASARSEDYLSIGGETSSRIVSPITENGDTHGCSSDNLSKKVSGKEYQPRNKNTDKFEAQEHAEHYLSKLQSQGEESRLLGNQRNFEGSSDLPSSEHNRPSVVVISPNPNEAGVGEQIQIITKSISRSFMKSTQRNNLLEPPVGTSSSALSEDSNTLRKDKDLNSYLSHTQRASHVRKTITNRRPETQMLKQKNKVNKVGVGTHNKNISKGRSLVINIKCKSPIRFDVPLYNKNLLQAQLHKKNSAISRLNGKDMPKEHLTLQEALARARPDYIREASDRRALIQLKKELRQKAQSHNREIVAQIPANLQTPSTLKRFLYKADVAPLFSYKDIREQNRRLYQLLPEANMPGVKQYRFAHSQTNRLMEKLYSQRLRTKVMKGQVSHAHKEIVTPLATRVRYGN